MLPLNNLAIPSLAFNCCMDHFAGHLSCTLLVVTIEGSLLSKVTADDK